MDQQALKKKKKPTHSYPPNILFLFLESGNIMDASTIPQGYTLSRYNSSELPNDIYKQCFLLVKKIQHMYEGSGMGWNSATKLDEFNEPEMIFLVIFKSENIPSSDTNQKEPKTIERLSSDAPESAPIVPTTPTIAGVTDKKLKKYLDQRKEGALGVNGIVCAFASVLPSVPEFEPDDKEDDDNKSNKSSLCSYLYELHVNPSYQSKGLAKHLLAEAKLLCLATHSHRSILKLTVFNMNVPAQNFYLHNNLKYINDVDKDSKSNAVPSLGGSRRKGEHKLHPKLAWTQSYSRIQNIKGWREMVWERKSPTQSSVM